MIWHNKEPNRGTLWWVDLMKSITGSITGRSWSQVLMRDTSSPANRQTNKPWSDYHTQTCQPQNHSLVSMRTDPRQHFTRLHSTSTEYTMWNWGSGRPSSTKYWLHSQNSRLMICTVALIFEYNFFVVLISVYNQIKIHFTILTNKKSEQNLLK